MSPHRADPEDLCPIYNYTKAYLRGASLSFAEVGVDDAPVRAPQYLFQYIPPTLSCPYRGWTVGGWAFFELPCHYFAVIGGHIQDCDSEELVGRGDWLSLHLHLDPHRWHELLRAWLVEFPRATTAVTWGSPYSGADEPAALQAIVGTTTGSRVGRLLAEYIGPLKEHTDYRLALFVERPQRYPKLQFLSDLGAAYCITHRLPDRWARQKEDWLIEQHRVFDCGFLQPLAVGADGTLTASKPASRRALSSTDSSCS